jgi:hypothetical protein
MNAFGYFLLIAGLSVCGTAFAVREILKLPKEELTKHLILFAVVALLGGWVAHSIDPDWFSVGVVVGGTAFEVGPYVTRKARAAVGRVIDRVSGG